METPTLGSAVRRAVHRTLVVAGICGIVALGTQATASAAPDPAGPSAERARYELQQQLQRQSELAALLSQLAKLRHDTAESIIKNIR